MTAPAIRTTIPREQTNQETAERLNEAPISALQAPAPSGAVGGFQPRSMAGADSLERQMEAFLRNTATATVDLSRDSRFTADGLEVKNQERVRAFDTGPVFPTGHSSGAGANTLQPFVNAFFNRERLNSGENVKPALGAPYLRGLGNAFGDRNNASNWATMAAVHTGMANVDISGFAQVNHTGNFIADRDTTYQPERGFRPGGPLYGADGAGGPNAGAAFSKQDGAGGGAVAQVALAAGHARGGAFALQPPSGAGALEAPRAYGIAALLSAV